jgi:hypothetical protein
MTLAPDSAKHLAQASPIPVVEPVTKTTFPVKFIEFLSPPTPLPLEHYRQARMGSRAGG